MLYKFWQNGRFRLHKTDKNTRFAVNRILKTDEHGN